MNINQNQIDAVIALSGQERYNNFIKVVVDWEEVWGLYQDNWALAGTDDGQRVFPVWPAKEYAQLCVDKEWDGCEPKSFSLEDFMSELLPNLKNDGVLPGVFYTPSDNGVTPTVEKLLEDLNEELGNY